MSINWPGDKTDPAIGVSRLYVCDNVIEGRLAWPWALQPNASNFWDERGVDMNGDGHVICHNVLRGFGDPIVNKTVLSRSWDAYGNDIYASFDGLNAPRTASNNTSIGKEGPGR